MKLYSWNVNGIRAVLNKELLQKFIDEHDPDILCLQETKAERGQVPHDWPQYEEHFFSAVKKGYSGTAMLSKTKPIRYLDGFPDDIVKKFGVTGDSYGDPNAEGRVIAAEFDSVWVVTVYTPNSKGDLSRLELRYKHWDPAFLAYMQQLERSKPVVFCGDLNVAHQEIDLANPKPNVGKHGFTDEERERFDDFLAAGYVDTFRAANPDKTEAEQLATRIIAEQAEIASYRIRRGAINDAEFAKIADAARAMQFAPLHIDQTGGISIAQLAAR
ncbi:exodeoxyribonuclease III, partial [Candidatus Saccharibacteria bacterium]|nr:exodeoxyribonuclease III [Candidatus Saccharibacteria bacterium]